ncbi:MAG: phosphoribosylglycinamide formyltransferase [Chitinophagaceae bacterium]|nr:phosphoribosylglycinamide formyltransferase [Chitinophagaceae bacterium]
MKGSKTINVAIFASGKGSNAKKIIEYFANHSFVKISLIVCNNSRAVVLEIASENGIPVLLIEKNQFKENGYLASLQKHKINFIVLAGFLWKIPVVLIDKYPGSIVNIHPALLPDYGGKGMYGMAVHNAVVSNKEKFSGITIHFVDEKYDHGKIILQEKVAIAGDETPESLAEKIHVLEHKWYPRAIEKVLNEYANTERVV